MKKTLATLALFMIFGSSFAQTDSKFYAVQFYADWCKYCKKLKPTFDELLGSYEDHQIEYVKLDFTDKETQEGAKSKIKELGLEKITKDYVGTGFILIVERTEEGSAVKDILDRRKDLEQMKKIVDGLVL